MPWVEVKPAFEPSVRGLCPRAYPGHPHGCPNFGKKSCCPPQARLIIDVLDMTKPIYAIWNVFDLAAHVGRMRVRHSSWSQRQLVCCLYWQQGARAALQSEINEFLCFGPRILLGIIRCPEAMGVNISKTMAQVEVILEWPPVNVAVQVALAGTTIASPPAGERESG